MKEEHQSVQSQECDEEVLEADSWVPDIAERDGDGYEDESDDSGEGKKI